MSLSFLTYTRRCCWWWWSEGCWSFSDVNVGFLVQIQTQWFFSRRTYYSYKGKMNNKSPLVVAAFWGPRDQPLPRCHWFRLATTVAGLWSSGLPELPSTQSVQPGSANSLGLQLSQGVSQIVPGKFIWFCLFVCLFNYGKCFFRRERAVDTYCSRETSILSTLLCG